MNNIKCGNKKKGVTLIELLVVCVIIGGSMTFVFNSYIKMREASNYCYQKMFSVFITVDLMERLLMSDPSLLKPAVGQPTRDNVISKISDLTENGRLVYPDHNNYEAVISTVRGGAIAAASSAGNPAYYIDDVPDSCAGYVVALKGLQTVRPVQEMLATFICYDYTIVP
ncbi:MAG: type II secretion system protein [Bacteroidales bacterium]|nr:type II secretion system protein [Bacteroidales bacterium]